MGMHKAVSRRDEEKDSIIPVCIVGGSHIHGEVVFITLFFDCRSNES
jgi:hypothetical protein